LVPNSSQPLSLAGFSGHSLRPLAGALGKAEKEQAMIPANSLHESEIAIPLPILERPSLRLEAAVAKDALAIAQQRSAYELHLSGSDVLIAFTAGLGVIAVFLWGFIRYCLFAQ
jgi:hypothetical protein